ncbi:MAG: MarR family transcriptional regulator [Pseudomonadota bacterium]
MTLDRLVRRIHVSLSNKALDFDPDRIGPAGAMLILTLDELGCVPMQTLAKNMHRDKSQMTRIVQMLERKELLTRQTSEADARVTLVALSEKGRALVATHQAALAETLDDLLGHLSDQDVAVLTRLLKIRPSNTD